MPSTSFWEDFLKNLISDPRSRSETQIVHTNSARRDCWKRSRSPLDMYLSKSVTFEIGQISCYLWSKHTFLPSQNRSIEQGFQLCLAYFDLRIKILAEIENKRTNSARRIYWNRFWAMFTPDMPKNVWKILRCQTMVFHIFPHIYIQIPS